MPPTTGHGRVVGRVAPLLLGLVLGGCSGKSVDTATGPADADGDGYESIAAGGEDCDDTDPAINPVAPELCDGIDNDCDRTVDESAAQDAREFFADADGDGYGAPEYVRTACEAPLGFVDNSDDCDDLNDTVYPGATEYCDDVDADCDGDLEDADDLFTFYTDADGDGFGDPESPVQACVQPSGTADNGTDCDDSSAGVNPEAAETWYDGVDQACDGGNDYDADGDGEEASAFGGLDCDDTNAFINPDATERCNGIDDDCDGRTDPSDADGASTYFRDGDRDGYGVESVSLDACERPTGYAEAIGDCDDTESTVNPGATEVWYDGVDQDCDGASDNDADGDGADALTMGGLDCDDTDSTVGPAETWWPDPDGDGYGDRSDGPDLVCDGELPSGMVDNGGDCDETDALINLGATEVPADGIDQNCDGGDRLDLDRDGFDDVALGGTDCDDTDPLVHPGAWEDETNLVDDDCDGDVDADDTDAAAAISLILGDDDFTEIRFVDSTVSFCGLEWGSAWVASNGRVTFGSGSIRSTPTVAAMGADAFVAGYWTDLDPTAGGEILWLETDQGVLVRFEDVPRFDSEELVSFTLALLADGTVTVDVEDAPEATAATGWSCGTGGATALDLSAELDTHPDLAAGLGQGTEEAVYELWDGTTTLTDLVDQPLRFCTTLGDDTDSDGWSDACGDPDDTAVTTVPR
jgi:hypothetical protein